MSWFHDALDFIITVHEFNDRIIVIKDVPNSIIIAVQFNDVVTVQFNDVITGISIIRRCNNSGPGSALIFTLPKRIGDATRWEASSDAIAIAID